MRALPLLLAASLIAAAGAVGCDKRTVVAKQIKSRGDLIGGPHSLGDVGDYLLTNGLIRIIVQDEGYSRGFGIYGGSLIDADMVRPESATDSSGGKGNDLFAELFPGLFLKAMRPTSVETQDNEDGSASVIVRGEPADFIFLAQNIIDVIVDSSELRFRNEYRLSPGKRYVEITTTLSYQGNGSVEIPGDGISQFLGEDLDFPLPVGDVILFGKGNSVFSEQAGFDVRFTLEDLYKQPVELPRLPGLLTPFLATKGDGVSYGFMSGVTDPNLSLFTRAGYDAPANSLLIPFLASSFTGAFYAAAPKRLYSRDKVCMPPDCPSMCNAETACPVDFNCVEGACRADAFSYKKYFIVGSGDVASIRDVVHEVRGEAVGRVSGIVRERFSQEPEHHASVMTFSESGSPYNQHTPDSNGNFTGNYQPGKYTYRVLADGRHPTPAVEFEVREGATTFLDIGLPSPGKVSVRVLGEDGRPLPAKCNLVATYSAAAAGFEGREFLYDFKLDEAYRATDLILDSEDASSRRFIEEMILAPTGQTTVLVRPGDYHAVCSRGMEYELYEVDISVKERGHVTIDAMLPRAFDTTGWASGDYHLHAINSIDSGLAIDERVAHVACEGVDIACSSDHNFVTDYRQSIASQGIESYLQGMVGLEMTTIEVGHFNGFPLRYDAEPITKGAFEWSGRTPQALFDDLRTLAAYSSEEMIVQVNHPRDTILGYFNDYNVNPDTMEPTADDNAILTPEGPEFGPEKFSWDFDAIEVFNGKRWDLLRTYRVPEVLPEPPLPMNIPAAGEILRDERGVVAYPGALEDWFQLLNQGRIYTATGNSDTHDLDDEPGTPRTYTPVSDDRAGAIDELEIVADMKNQRALVTNGPFVTIAVTTDGGCFDRKSGAQLENATCGMGQVASLGNGRAVVTVEVKTASWVKIELVNLIVNGQVVASTPGDRNTLSQLSTELEINGDGWVVAEVIGSESMFPVVTPREIPSIQVSDAIGSIAGSFGFDFDPFGNLKPAQTRIATPYAVTNPVFLDAGGTPGEYDPPGAQRQALTADTPDTGKGRVMGVRKRSDRQIPALLKLFQLFGSHGH